jgi:hypothetical protein
VDEKDIRSFLVQHPRGARVLVRDEDDEIHSIAGPTGKGGTWAQVARSIVALRPVLIEIHDADEKLLRATRTTESTPSIPGISQPTMRSQHDDPETARLQHFADLIHRSYEFSMGTAFTKMVEMFQMVNDRHANLETRLERTEANYRREMKERLDEAFERAEEMAAAAQEKADEQATEAADPLGGLVQTFMAGRANGAAAAPNGAAKGKQ